MGRRGFAEGFVILPVGAFAADESAGPGRHAFPGAEKQQGGWRDSLMMVNHLFGKTPCF
jgi:hypothetical protein